MYDRFEFVSGKSVEFVNDYVLLLLAAAVFEHFLESNTIVVSAGHSAVNISIDN